MGAPPLMPKYLIDSDHTRDDVRTQSSKNSSLCYRTKTTSQSDFQGCGCSPHLIHNAGESIPNIPRKGCRHAQVAATRNVVESDNKGYCFYNHVYLQSVYCHVTLIVIHNTKAKQALCLHAVVNVRLHLVCFQH